MDGSGGVSGGGSASGSVSDVRGELKISSREYNNIVR